MTFSVAQTQYRDELQRMQANHFAKRFLHFRPLHGEAREAPIGSVPEHEGRHHKHQQHDGNAELDRLSVGPALKGSGAIMRVPDISRRERRPQGATSQAVCSQKNTAVEEGISVRATRSLRVELYRRSSRSTCRARSRHSQAISSISLRALTEFSSLAKRSHSSAFARNSSALDRVAMGRPPWSTR